MLALFLMGGCASSTLVSVKPTAQANLTSECTDLEQFQGKDLGDLTQYLIQVINQYGECKSKQKALAASFN
jgi:hypothetical protein